jgi:capsular exopolysaccharide synthesis family protein
MNDKLERFTGRDGEAALQYPLPSEVPSLVREPETNFQIHLLDYWKVLVKRWWIVVVTLITFVSVSSFLTWRQPPIYRASLKLQIDNEQSNFLPFRDSAESFSYVSTEEFLKTQFEALTSRTLATRVIKAMNLESDPRYAPKYTPDAIDRIVRRIRGAITWRFQYRNREKPPEKTKYDGTYSTLADAVLAGITISPIKDSSVVIISFDARDPVLAADVVNTLAAQYISMNFETKYQSTKVASDFLGKQLVEVKSQVEKSEEELVKFGQTHNIYTLGAKENVIMQKLSDLNTALTQAQADRIQKESIWRIASKASSGPLPESASTNDIKAMESNVANLQQQLSKLRAVYKPDWWEVKQIAFQLETAEKQLAKVREDRLKDLGTAYQTALQRERLLSDAVKDQKQQADALNEYSIQYNILKQEVDSSKQLYDLMLQRMKEAGITAGLKSSNIHVVDAAIPPSSPILPNKNGNVTKALLSGLVFGIALAFFFEYVGSYFDRSLKTPEDVDRVVKLPFLGLIPSTHSFDHTGARKPLMLYMKSRNVATAKTSPNGKNGQSNIELITLCNTKSLISEAYRHLRTSILLSSNGHNRYKSIVVTSSKHGEGKTSTCINLAVTLAQANKKVLLMDCDLRNPKIHRILGLKNVEGMSSFLANGSDPLNNLIRPTTIPNLFVLTSGQIPPNPSELVGSPLMKKCLSVLSQRFDHVLVDTPPLLAVTDGSILANMVDGVILVISGGDTPKEAIIRSKHLLACAQARIIGAMLNNVDLHTCEPSYYSRYFYGYDIENNKDVGSSDSNYAAIGIQGRPS